jgi:ferredoxin
MKVTADQDVCATTGQCALAVPEVFTSRDGDGVVEVLLPEPPTELESAVLQAARRCPVAAIIVQD